MLTIEMIDTRNKKQVDEFIEFHYKLYRGTPQWVPPFYDDIRAMMNREKHPYYEVNDADFFVARRDGEVVARVVAMENRSYNNYHGAKKAQFYLFDAKDDQEAFDALFARVSEWAKARGLDTLVGPKGFSPFDGYGVLEKGYEHRQMMVMMNYNFPYYIQLFERGGFEKEVDFVSCYLHRDKFRIPEKAKLVAAKVRERGHFKIKTFKSQRELKEWAYRIGKAYNDTFVNNWEYYPLTEKEMDFQLGSILTIAVPEYLKFITYDDDKIVGFLLGFPDISTSLQANGGKNPVFRPWNLAKMMRELKTTSWISMNGAGVLPEYHGRGGVALLFDEMERTMHESHFEHCEMTQVAETAVQMRQELVNLGGDPYKNHRIFHKAI